MRRGREAPPPTSLLGRSRFGVRSGAVDFERTLGAGDFERGGVGDGGSIGSAGICGHCSSPR